MYVMLIMRYKLSAHFACIHEFENNVHSITIPSEVMTYWHINSRASNKIEVKALLKMEVEVRQYHFKNNDSELCDYALFFNFAIE